ncbi:hypothetical protein PENSPDRAFT_670446 [Peniophora sp. CONT]|nr:hypothetical protein PENSPDRAFT_670446 [Peniophora sp. CONT]
MSGVNTSNVWFSQEGLAVRLEPMHRIAQNRLSSSQEISAAREAGLAELEKARRAVANIRTALNGLQPACRIPDDILVYVFSILRDVSPAKKEYSGGLALGWIQVSHVARLWRHAALNAPSLWAKIDLALGRQWAFHFLSLSKSTPLFVKLRSYPLWDSHASIQSFVEQASPRTVSLTLASPTLDMCEVIHTFIAHSMPSLECLHVDLRMQLSFPFTASRFGSLRRLTITENALGRKPDWASFPTTLRELEIEHKGQPCGS